METIKKFFQQHPWAFPAIGITIVAFFIALFIGRSLGGPPPAIINIDPPTNNPISIYQVFKITFDREPSQNQKNRFSFVLSQGSPLSSAWIDNAVLLSPATPLELSKNYILSVSYDQKPIASVSYSTVSLKELSREDEARLQTESDFIFNKEQEKLFQEKPWLNLLPITTSEYTVVYDYDLQKIRIRLKAPYTATQKTALLQSLSKKGIPTNAVVWIEK